MREIRRALTGTFGRCEEAKRSTLKWDEWDSSTKVWTIPAVELASSIEFRWRNWRRGSW